MNRKRKQIKIKRFLCKVINFLRNFYRWNIANVQQRTAAVFSKFFEDQLQFHFRKQPQNDPEIVLKIFLQLLGKLVFFERYQNFVIF